MIKYRMKNFVDADKLREKPLPLRKERAGEQLKE